MNQHSQHAIAAPQSRCAAHHGGAEGLLVGAGSLAGGILQGLRSAAEAGQHVYGVMNCSTATGT